MAALSNRNQTALFLIQQLINTPIQVMNQVIQHSVGNSKEMLTETKQA